MQRHIQKLIIVKQKNLAFQVNAHAVKVIAEISKKSILLIHFSTDYVFDGKKSNYNETDMTNPINVYGESKLLGEKYIIETGGNFLILRISWVYGKSGKTFKNNN